MVRALAAGTPTIDQSRSEVQYTGDISVYAGHVYSNKLPGFAFATLPAYFVMKLAGKADPVPDTTGQLWFLGLWSSVLPGLVLLLLVRKIADELEPGFGTAAAVTLGLATLILPFSTLFFSHAFSAMLCFAAFALLWHERRRPASLAWVGAAGLLAGYAMTTELPNAIAAAALGCYALTRSGVVRRAIAYGTGAIVGIAPLLIYNQWAFGSPFHLSYQSTVGFGPTGSLFLGPPSFRSAVELLFAPIGLLRTTPVVALGVVGTLLLYRRGHRAEALLISTIVLAYFIFDTSYDAPFGGGSPGPRQLIPILPFLALPLAAAFRRFPLTSIGLGAVSAAEMVVLTLTVPIYAAEYPNWFHRFFRWDLSRTSLGLFGAPEDYGIALFFFGAVLALLFAALVTVRPIFSWRESATGAALVAGWVLIQRQGPHLLNGDRLGNGAFATLLLCAAVIVAALALPRLVVPGSTKGLAGGFGQRE